MVSCSRSLSVITAGERNAGECLRVSQAPDRQICGHALGFASSETSDGASPADCRVAGCQAVSQNGSHHTAATTVSWSRFHICTCRAWKPCSWNTAVQTPKAADACRSSAVQVGEFLGSGCAAGLWARRRRDWCRSGEACGFEQLGEAAYLAGCWSGRDFAEDGGPHLLK